MIEGQYLELYKKGIDEVLARDDLTIVRIDLFDCIDKDKQYSLSEWLDFLFEGSIKKDLPIPIKVFTMNFVDTKDMYDGMKKKYLNKKFPFIDIVFDTEKNVESMVVDENGDIVMEELEDGDIIPKLELQKQDVRVNFPIDDLEAVKNSNLVTYLNNL